MNEAGIEPRDAGWSSFYRVAGVAALLVVPLGVLDIVLSFVPGGATPDPGKGSALEWLVIYQHGWFLGMRGLGFWNVITMSLGVVVFLALYRVHRHTMEGYALLALICWIIGSTIYTANNPACPMLRLSSDYAAATAEAARTQVLGAVAAVLARGEDFTPGSFMAFVFMEIAGILMAFVMLRGRVFTRTASVLGLSGFFGMLVFVVWAVFIPTLYMAAMFVSMVAGLALMVWYILVARTLFRFASGDTARRVAERVTEHPVPLQ